MKKVYKGRKAQTAIEYMLLLGVVVALVLVAFKTSLPRLHTSANVYFNRAEIGILGKPNPCGDGYCCSYFEDQNKCPVDCPSGIAGCPPEPTVNGCVGPGNIPIAHGGSYTYYQTSIVPCTDTCSSQVRVCDNGSLSGSYTATSCFAACGPVCGFNGCELGETCGTCPTDCGVCPLNCPAAPGGALAHGASRTYYQASSVPCGNSCVSETRTCTDGILSGTYTNTSCSPSCANCPSAPGGALAHGASRTYYSATSVACGSTCASVAETRTCNNGFLSGSYTNLSCTVTGCLDCPSAPGGFLAHNASRTYYRDSSVTCLNSCVSETRTCNNGTLPGTYTNLSCTKWGCCTYGPAIWIGCHPFSDVWDIPPGTVDTCNGFLAWQFMSSDCPSVCPSTACIDIFTLGGPLVGSGAPVGGCDCSASSSCYVYRQNVTITSCQ